MFVRGWTRKVKVLCNREMYPVESLMFNTRTRKEETQGSSRDKVTNSNCSSQREHSLCCVFTLLKPLMKLLHREVGHKMGSWWVTFPHGSGFSHRLQLSAATMGLFLWPRVVVGMGQTGHLQNFVV